MISEPILCWSCDKKLGRKFDEAAFGVGLHCTRCGMETIVGRQENPAPGVRIDGKPYDPPHMVCMACEHHYWPVDPSFRRDCPNCHRKAGRRAEDSSGISAAGA